MTFFLIITWILIGALICYIAFVWRQESYDGDWSNAFWYDNGFVPIIEPFYLVSGGILWPLALAAILLTGRKFKGFQNPVRWLVRELQNPKGNV